MPKSRVRKKTAYTAPAAVTTTTKKKKKYGAAWVGPTMTAFFLIGVIWLVIYYLSDSHNVPLPIQAWNLAVGFGFLIVGFILSTRWR